MRFPRLFRAFGACVMMVAWFAVSNHCGLAMIHALHSDGHLCCDSPNGAPRQSPEEPAKVCCKQLRLLPAESGTKLVNIHPETFCFEIEWAPVIAALAENATCVANLSAAAANSPHGDSFAETVLQESLLSHAPPVGV
jgi:hypothetical protein